MIKSTLLPTRVVTPPDGARLHSLCIRVKEDREWKEAVNAAGPNTPEHYNVRKVGDLYVPTGVGEVEKRLILLNYPAGGGNWVSALTWGEEQGLKLTVPRDAFTIGEQYPNLHTTLNQNPMYVVATTECTFDGVCQACLVWWGDSNREAVLNLVDDLRGSDGWFAFGE